MAPPPAELMAAPPKFADLPAGKGADLLPWSIDTLKVGGDLRSRLIRLQEYVRGIVQPPPSVQARP